MRIENKADCNRLYFAGEFGNKLQTWPTWDEFARSSYQGYSVVRYAEPASPFCRYDLESKEEAACWVSEAVSAGAQRDLFSYQEQAPDWLIVLQGEVYRGVGGLWLTYSTVKAQMRPALKQKTEHAQGLAASMLLLRNLDIQSWDNLHDLLDRFDGAVVEFSCYERGLGLLGWNTLFWEVRNY